MSLLRSDSLVVEKRVWDHSSGGLYKIKLEAEWEEHAGKEATKWYLAGYNSLNIKSNLLFPRALGETISVYGSGFGFFSGRVTKVIAPKRQEGRQGRDRVLLDAGEKGLYVLEAPEPLSELPPRVSAALALANKCLM